MKRYVKKIVILILITVLSWGAWKIIRPFLRYNTNELYVTAEKPLTIENVVIEKGFFSISRKSDKELFTGKQDIVFNGKEIRKISNGYGENDFLITYGNTYYYQFRHFKTYRAQMDTYKFRIYQKDGAIMVKVSIDGTDPMELERRLNPIDQADRLVGNGPILNAKQ